VWERFELFWTALEKFALFFSFVATLTVLVIMVLIYRWAIDLEPAGPAFSPEDVAKDVAEDIAPVIDITRRGFEQIHSGVLTTEILVEQTVPVTFTVHSGIEETELSVVDKFKIDTDEVLIELRNEAGWIAGKRASLEVKEGNTFKVKMDISEPVVIKVPIKVSVPVEIPLSALDLTPLIEELEQTDEKMQTELSALPQEGAIETAQR
jgi:hypothetical protein